MTRATYRFREHTLTPDTGPESDPWQSAMECKGCGRCSEKSESAEDGTAWAAEHLKANPGHLTYREVITRPYRFDPGEWL
ncbi:MULTISPECIES: DUF7848 domain-containing protein [unclassified Streptomyces]|uniref:DUF7848 domain-containing protein n=1 Tax=unclassified Streptomyces TaxID=2593676 RepID=UPI000DAEB293|nr:MULTISPECIES: hypothetical protein [unclassified Streptomyces]PZT77677.1 hypothetical protein DNK56_31485 [Streptomyces sp. AC1-42W]PZT78371.1 hypothetical protein DNK55_01200 [Streptomyces sp. AC1-42T]